MLETLFDDTRLHLTEKSLRPIACGRPFILATAPGSLAYLRSYGFKTFDRYIDETYDTITNSFERLEAIKLEITRLSKKTYNELQQMQDEMTPIFEHNRKKFIEFNK